MIMIIVFFKKDKVVTPELQEEIKADLGSGAVEGEKSTADAVPRKSVTEERTS